MRKITYFYLSNKPFGLIGLKINQGVDKYTGSYCIEGYPESATNFVVFYLWVVFFLPYIVKQFVYNYIEDRKLTIKTLLKGGRIYG